VIFAQFGSAAPFALGAEGFSGCGLWSTTVSGDNVAERERRQRDELRRDLWQHRKSAPLAGDRDLVWPSDAGTPLDYSNMLSDVLKPAAERAGLPWAAWHSLRHTCATLLVVEQGFDPKRLQRWLGHESAAFSLEVYTHLTSDDLPVVEWSRSRVHAVSTSSASVDQADAEAG